MIYIGKDRLGIDRVLDYEYLIANGTGGYASSSLLSINTRKYHGILIASTPKARYHMVATIEEKINNAYISSNIYPDSVFPEGYKHILSVTHDIFPTMRYFTGDAFTEKTVFTINGKNTTCILYHIVSDSKIDVEMRPLITMRELYSLNDDREYDIHIFNDFFRIEREGVPLYIYSDLNFVEEPVWYYNLHYEWERKRGEEHLENLFSPCVLRREFNKECRFFICFSYEEIPERTLDIFDNLLSMERERVYDIVDKCCSTNRIKRDLFIDSLVKASDSFVVKKEGEYTVYAGYPWFEEWGRDAMISFPGLFLITGRIKEAKSVLKRFCERMKDGIIPNRIDKECSYNSVDASLWFINAVYKFLEYTNDYEYVRRELYRYVKEVIESYIDGTNGIKLDTDMLIKVEKAPLTWMDAIVDNVAVTPRYGKPVEIEALWYNALRIGEMLSRRFNDSNEWGEIANRVKKEFNRKFVSVEKPYLFDTVEPNNIELMPNQIFSISLPFPVLEKVKWEKVLLSVKKLLTPFGLRSLDKDSPQYSPFYDGDFKSRDLSYHRGVSWVWLLGPFITSYMRVYNHSIPAKRFIIKFILEPLMDSLETGAIGTLCEISDSEYPYMQKGCVAQAWSVSEILRAYVEDILR